ncbi:hypothetical protein MPTK1_4g08920 [Marchantia polymorpha subsp. ruderalis]|uniref:MOSC domain-containing protein n=1 Tax=Marchantia polymorpha subsp. ruderalis TaxID=1480154 RepID=A0AAF6B7X2_MARPO|nr:hypothetical protein Mp_4g08920 [Marchantia polymorpha subsp. ruderalis]
MGASVTAVCLSQDHTFSKGSQYSIRLLTGEGVAGDAHCGKYVQHVHHKKIDASQPNLRQVHIIQAELHDELQSAGLNVAPGQMGENITIRGVDIISLPLGTRLKIGSTAVVELTGLRSTCAKLNKIHSGLLKAVQPYDHNGNVMPRAGVMSIVVRGAEVRPGDPIQVELPNYPHQPLPVL